MPSGRPRAGYATQSGGRVPGVTTIVSRFKDSGALVAWANKIGLEGKTTREVSDAACNAGSICHDMIDAHIHSRAFDRAGLDDALVVTAEHAFLGYLQWAERSSLNVVASEVSLVSEEHQFGGTFDAAVSGSGLCLLDYKTSNGIYTDMLIQVGGGYSLLWKEHHPDEPLSGIDILRVSKPSSPGDPVSFHHHHWSAEIFPIAEEQFLLFRKAYDNDKRLKGLL